MAVVWTPVAVVKPSTSLDKLTDEENVDGGRTPDGGDIVVATFGDLLLI